MGPEPRVGGVPRPRRWAAPPAAQATGLALFNPSISRAALVALPGMTLDTREAGLAGDLFRGGVGVWLPVAAAAASAAAATGVGEGDTVGWQGTTPFPFSPDPSGLVALEVAEGIAEFVRDAGTHCPSARAPPGNMLSSRGLLETAHIRRAPANASAGKGSATSALGSTVVGSMGARRSGRATGEWGREGG